MRDNTNNNSPTVTIIENFLKKLEGTLQNLEELKAAAEAHLKILSPYNDFDTYFAYYMWLSFCEEFYEELKISTPSPKLYIDQTLINEIKQYIGQFTPSNRTEQQKYIKNNSKITTNIYQNDGYQFQSLLRKWDIITIILLKFYSAEQVEEILTNKEFYPILTQLKQRLTRVGPLDSYEDIVVVENYIGRLNRKLLSNFSTRTRITIFFLLFFITIPLYLLQLGLRSVGKFLMRFSPTHVVLKRIFIMGLTIIWPQGLIYRSQQNAQGKLPWISIGFLLAQVILMGSIAELALLLQSVAAFAFIGKAALFISLTIGISVPIVTSLLFGITGMLLAIGLQLINQLTCLTIPINKDLNGNNHDYTIIRSNNPLNIYNYKLNKTYHGAQIRVNKNNKGINHIAIKHLCEKLIASLNNYRILGANQKIKSLNNLIKQLEDDKGYYTYYKVFCYLCVIIHNVIHKRGYAILNNNTHSGDLFLELINSKDYNLLRAALLNHIDLSTKDSCYLEDNSYSLPLPLLNYEHLKFFACIGKNLAGKIIAPTKQGGQNLSANADTNTPYLTIKPL